MRGRFLACWKSRVERDKIRVEFDIQNAETYMIWGTYILNETKSGMHEERRQYPEGTIWKEHGGLCHGSWYNKKMRDN